MAKKKSVRMAAKKAPKGFFKQYKSQLTLLVLVLAVVGAVYFVFKENPTGKNVAGKAYGSAANANEAFVQALFDVYAGKAPAAGRFEYYVKLLQSGKSQNDVFNEFVNSGDTPQCVLRETIYSRIKEKGITITDPESMSRLKLVETYAKDKAANIGLSNTGTGSVSNTGSDTPAIIFETDPPGASVYHLDNINKELLLGKTPLNIMYQDGLPYGGPFNYVIRLTGYKQYHGKAGDVAYYNPYYTNPYGRNVGKPEDYTEKYSIKLEKLVPLEGEFEGVKGDDCSAWGWAYDPNDKYSYVTARIFSDDIKIKEVVSKINRDSLTTKCRDGNCAWFVSLKGLITPGVDHTIVVKTLSTYTDTLNKPDWVTLKGSPKTLKCS